jgi:tetratricopeptide (TPR) repeat protein
MRRQRARLPTACVIWAAWSWPAQAVAADSRVARAEAMAAAAVGEAETQPQAALERARSALALTQDFDPTAFVAAGRKGEMVEDAYLQARGAYRRHRSSLYEAVGRCLARAGRPVEASRYLRRAVDLEPRVPTAVALAQALTSLGRPREALAVLLNRPEGDQPAELLAAASAAADAARLPSLQAELDRARLAARRDLSGVRQLPAPLVVPEHARLSTGGAFRLAGGELWLLYVAEPPCRTCSADLEALKRLAPSTARVAMAPAIPDRDDALRRVIALYRYDWPFVLGKGVAGSLGATPPALVIAGRRGFSAVALDVPVAATLAAVLEIYGREDVREVLPRSSWNGQTPTRPAPAIRPGVRPDGLAPGEDEPAPATFDQAVAAFEAGRAAQALALFETLEALGDGWLLPPEARLNRARCLAAVGRRDEARQLLLRTGDSRLQDAVDRALDEVGSR